MFFRISFALSIVVLAGCGGGKPEAAPTAQPLQILATTPPAQLTGTLRYSFVDKFPTGTINSQAAASTPTGRGALIVSWHFGPSQIKTLTVLDTFRYSFSNVAVQPGDELTFEAAKPLPVGGPVQAFVDITDGGKTSRVFATRLPAATSSGPVWKNYAVSLKAFAGHRVTVVFGADAVKKGNNLGAWAAFGNPGVYALSKHS